MSDISQNIINAKRLIEEIKDLAACPTNIDKVKTLAVWNRLIDEVKAMGVDIERIKE
jgi:hypothetical protein